VTHDCPVALFGECVVDEFESGAVVGGAPFNVARHLAAFGHAPLMLTAIGADENGRRIQLEFERYAMRRDGVQRLTSHATGVVEVTPVDGGGHAFRIARPSAWDFINPEAVDILRRQVGPQGWLYHGTLALREEVSRQTWRALIAAHRGGVYMDLNWRAGHVERDAVLEALAAADVLKVNDEELAMLASWLGLPSGEGCIEGILRRFPVRLLIVTRGEQGYAAFDGSGARVAAGAAHRVRRQVDTVGAGDAFSAVVLAGFVRGWPIDAALQRANRFAAQVCAIRGAVPKDLQWYGQASSSNVGMAGGAGTSDNAGGPCLFDP
jgi:fructokinase